MLHEFYFSKLVLLSTLLRISNASISHVSQLSRGEFNALGTPDLCMLLRGRHVFAPTPSRIPNSQTLFTTCRTSGVASQKIGGGFFGGPKYLILGE